MLGVEYAEYVYCACFYMWAQQNGHTKAEKLSRERFLRQGTMSWRRTTGSFWKGDFFFFFTTGYESLWPLYCHNGGLTMNFPTLGKHNYKNNSFYHTRHYLEFTPVSVLKNLLEVLWGQYRMQGSLVTKTYNMLNMRKANVYLCTILMTLKFIFKCYLDPRCIPGTFT